MLILFNNLILRSIEKILIEIVDEIILTKSLKAEVNHLVPPRYTAHSRRVIRYGFYKALIKHLAVHCLVKIFKK
jgi:hypothetical protein